jgi:hypothetical protein
MASLVMVGATPAKADAYWYRHGFYGAHTYPYYWNGYYSPYNAYNSYYNWYGNYGGYYGGYNPYYSWYRGYPWSWYW